jgi:hypothetical protein
MHFILYEQINISYSNRVWYINAIISNPSFAGSHFGLSTINEARAQIRVQNVLSSYFYLLMEPESDDAKTAYSSLMEYFWDNAGAREKAETMIRMFEAINSSKENKDKTPEELFVENTKSLFINVIKKGLVAYCRYLYQNLWHGKSNLELSDGICYSTCLCVRIINAGVLNGYISLFIQNLYR